MEMNQLISRGNLRERFVMQSLKARLYHRTLINLKRVLLGIILCDQRMYISLYCNKVQLSLKNGIFLASSNAVH